MKENEMSQEVKEATKKHYFEIARKWIELIIIIIVSITVSVVAWNYMTTEMETTDKPSLIVIWTGIIAALLFGVLIIPVSSYIENSKGKTKKEMRMIGMNPKVAKKRGLKKLNFFEYVWNTFEDEFFLPFPLIIFALATTGFFLKFLIMQVVNTRSNVSIYTFIIVLSTGMIVYYSIKIILGIKKGEKKRREEKEKRKGEKKRREEKEKRKGEKKRREEKERRK